MKTPMQSAFDRIELMRGFDKDSVHWQMFKQNYLEREKKALKDSFYEGMKCYPFDPNLGRAEIWFNETFKNE